MEKTYNNSLDCFYKNRISISDSHKMVFVCGLHRSGTTLLARCLNSHPLISGFKDTDADEDEGQHLQNIYPPDDTIGGPGRFGFHRDGHLTENSKLISDANRNKIYNQWSAYWDLQKQVLLEKSPPNTIRSRFLQSLFPNTYFVFLIRHPAASSYATLKFKRGLPLFFILWHWIICHEIVYEDIVFLQNSLIIKYEDFVREPVYVLKNILCFLGLEHYFFEYDLTKIKPDVNKKYFEKWQNLPLPYRKAMELYYESRVRKFGYSLEYLEEIKTIRGSQLSRPRHMSHRIEFELGSIMNSFVSWMGL